MHPEEPNWEEARDRIIGLGETSARKSYYPELQKRLEELHASESDLRTIFNSIHDAIFIHDLAGNVEDVNEAMLRMFGVTRSEALRFTIADYTSRATPKARLTEILRHMDQDGSDAVFEWSARRPLDGGEFPVEVALRMAVWKGKRMAVAVVRDITERLHAEEERKRLEEQLAQSRKMELVGQLAGGVAHDFNNMLTPILSYATLLRDDVQEGDPRRADLDEIVRSALRARDLTRQLLAFARKQKLVLKRIDLNQVIIGFHRMLSRTLRENIRIQLQLAEPLDPIDGDTGQIEQILLNLGVNAQDAMVDGGELLIRTDKIVLSEKRGLLPPGTYIRLIVSDTGQGMDDEVKARIFEPFFTTKGHGRGTGLGLATVYGIVRQHGAHIMLDSAPGKGSRFEITFPAATEPAPKAVEPAAAAWENTAKGVILLVEDQDAVRQSTRSMLERIGYTVITAANGKEAIETAQQHVGIISLLVTDVIMDGINGRDLYEQLSKRQPSLKVLYMSGYPVDVIGRHGILGDETYFLPKPFTPQEIVPAILRALAGK